MASLSSVLKLTLLDGVTGPARRIQGVLSNFQRQQTAMMAPFRGIGGQLLAFGAGYIGVTKGISGTVGAAIEFESAFADVRKVVDASDEQFENFARTIKSMSRELPMTSTEIAQLWAAAGESNIPVDQLKSFSEMAARVGIAFDMSAGDAGESLAKLKSQLGLTVAETGEMADAINHLSNNMASKAKDITAYMLRVGKFGEMSGFTKDQVAAIGSAMISAGAEAETAGTAMMNVVRKMTSGEFAKKDQLEAAKALGLHLPTLAKQMKKDAPKALKTVLQAIAKAPAEKQLALLSKFFGDEARAFAPLVGNVGLLDRAFDLVGDRTNYAGSALKEYIARASTTANALQILRNKIAYVFEDMGEAWLPTIKEGVTAIGGVLDTLGERAGIFDEMGAGLKGFMQGLGYDGGVKEAIEGLGDLLFGEVDGDGAADKLGRIFKQFEGYGETIRKFKKDLEDNPIVKFFGEIAGQGFKLMLASVGIGIVAGAIMKLGRALAFLSGITTAISILKSVAKIGGILKDVPIPTVPGDGKNKPANDGKPGGWGTGWRGFLAAFQMFDAYANMPSTKEGIEELYKKNRDGSSGFNKWLDSRITTPSEWFRNRFVNDNSSHPYLNKGYDDGGRAASQDAFLDGPVRMPTGGSPRTTGEMLSGLNKPVTLDAATISQLATPRGVQEVREVNREKPIVQIHAPVTISNISSPLEAVDAAASQLGQRAKAAVEGAYSD
jgi:TP901 family phage tail tape measure protein